MKLRTPLCDLLGIETPIMLAGMGGIASKELVAAVSNAGGFGTVSQVASVNLMPAGKLSRILCTQWGSALDVKNKGPDELLEEVREMGRMCRGRPFGVDILVHGGDGGVMKQLIDIFAKGGARAFISGKGYPRRQVIDLFHERGMLVGSIAGRVGHAVKAVEAGVDFVIAQGYEAGGHTGEIALSVLLPQVVDAVAHRVPVVAAGGIYDGRGLAAALALGASGVWVGTRFMMTPESNTHQLYKERLLRATSDDTMVTKAFTGARLRVLRNNYTTKYERQPELLEDSSPAIARRAWADGCWRLHSGTDEELQKGVDDDVQAFVSGQNIGAIDQLLPAARIIEEMTQRAAQILTNNAGARVEIEPADGPATSRL